MPPAPNPGAETDVATDETQAAPPAGSISEREELNVGDLAFEALGGSVRYEPGQMLGAGGMGEVRLHLDRRIGRRVARKTMRDGADRMALRRFLREVRVQGQLEHPAIVPVYDLDTDDEQRAFFTMKRVRGETLEHVVEQLRAGDPGTQRRFGRRRLLSAFVQICMAIHYAHSREVLHRDLKPSNVMFGHFGEVYVLDWGVAKVLSEPEEMTTQRIDTNALENLDEGALVSFGGGTAVVGASGSLTVGGAILGTLAYMAPEQLQGDMSPLDARADVFALGAILFEILTLSPLRSGPDVRAVLRQALSKEAIRPSSRVDDVPPELDELCTKALSPDPRDRPRTAGELAEAIERYLDGEHDSKLRQDVAAKHAALARERLVADGASRAEALREAMKALTLDAGNRAAQELLVELVTDTSGAVPPEAQAEMDATTARERAAHSKVGMHSLATLLLVVPLVLAVGVKSWPAVAATAAATAAATLWARHMWRSGTTTRGLVVLACLVALILAGQSCYLGPFTLGPTCAATAAMFFTMGSSKRERWPLGLILAVGVLVPFGAEAFGVGPAAYAFGTDGMKVFARAVELPRAATIGMMAYTAASYTLLSVLMLGRVRDMLTEAQRQNFLQAWYLRHLFPGARPEAEIGASVTAIWNTGRKAGDANS